MRLGMSMGLRQEQSIRQTMSLEQRLALKLKQELQLKMSLKQVMKLVQKLWPQLNLGLGQKLEQHLTTVLRNNFYLRESLPQYLEREPTAVELQREFPQMASLFNMHYKSGSDYGAQLRKGNVVAPKKTRSSEGPGIRLELRQSLQLSQSLTQRIKLPYTNWSLVDAYKDEEDKGCRLPKKKLDSLDSLSLEQRLKRVDEENAVFKFAYVQRRGKYFKVPLLRNLNIDPDDIAVPISKQEYKDANAILENAGRVQRIVRAVPYSEIRQTLIDHVESAGYDLDDVVLVGVDRGGRLPTGIVKNALGKERAYFLKVDQGSRESDMERLQHFIDNGTFRGKYVVFVDSTVDSGRQISALRSYFDDEDIKRDIGHRGWVVVGSNEDGQSLDNHINLDWGLDPDQSFEDDPNLMGVDYAGSHTKVRACPTKMSTGIRKALFEVPKGVVLDVSGIVKSKVTPKTEQKASEETVSAHPSEEVTISYKASILLIIGDGQNRSIGDNDAKYLALKVERRFNIIAGTADGNPGYILELVHDYDEAQGVTLIQPAYMKGKGRTNGFNVVYEGATKDQFRDSMIARADMVLALGGNEGTWAEIQKSLASGKPTFVIRNLGRAGTNAAQLEGYTNLHLLDSLEKAVEEMRAYQV